MGEVRSVPRESEGMDYSLHVELSRLTTKANVDAKSIRPCDMFTYKFGSSSGG